MQIINLYTQTGGHDQQMKSYCLEIFQLICSRKSITNTKLIWRYVGFL